MDKDESDPSNLNASRRKFVKGLAVGAFLAAAGSVAFSWAYTDLVEKPKPKLALSKGVIEVDPTLCAGCAVCKSVCSTYNSGECNVALARIEVPKDYIGGNYDPKPCQQCEDSPCLRSCTVGAIYVDRFSGTNARVLDERVCIGCKVCLDACNENFDPPRIRFDPEKNVCIKCHLCFGDPQCVKFCPSGALRYVESAEGIVHGYPSYIDKEWGTDWD